MADEYESYLGSLKKFQDYSECLGPGQGCFYRLLEKLGCVTLFTLKSRICWFRREKWQGFKVTHKLHFHRRNSSHPVLFQTWRTSTEQRPQPETDNLSRLQRSHTGTEQCPAGVPREADQRGHYRQPGEYQEAADQNTEGGALVWRAELSPSQRQQHRPFED